LYKQVLTNGQVSDKGGGGLGIIDIAKKSGEKLDYGFMPVDDFNSFFSLNVSIPNKIKKASWTISASKGRQRLPP